MDFLFLTEADVSRLLSMPDSMDAVESAMKATATGRAVNRPRERARMPEGTLHLMGAGLPEEKVAGLKSYLTTPSGAQFHVLLYSLETGRLIALMEADRLGQQRTGAASGAATRRLARPDADAMTLFGAGWQAESQLEAVALVRDLKRVFVCNRSPERRESFCRAMSERLGIPVVGADDPAEAVAQSSIVTTVTSAREPVLKGEWLRPGTHVNAVGSNGLLRREIDMVTLRRASLIVVDSREQAERESGDLLQGVERGLIGWSALPELGELLAREGFSRPDDAITLFESHGLALWDVAVAARVYRKAKAEGAA